MEFGTEEQVRLWHTAILVQREAGRTHPTISLLRNDKSNAPEFHVSFIIKTEQAVLPRLLTENWIDQHVGFIWSGMSSMEVYFTQC